jgi:hypothetical protein
MSISQECSRAGYLTSSWSADGDESFNGDRSADLAGCTGDATNRRLLTVTGQAGNGARQPRTSRR